MSGFGGLDLYRLFNALAQLSVREAGFGEHILPSWPRATADVLDNNLPAWALPEYPAIQDLVFRDSMLPELPVFGENCTGLLQLLPHSPCSPIQQQHVTNETTHHQASQMTVSINDAPQPQRTQMPAIQYPLSSAEYTPGIAEDWDAGEFHSWEPLESVDDSKELSIIAKVLQLPEEPKEEYFLVVGADRLSTYLYPSFGQVLANINLMKETYYRFLTDQRQIDSYVTREEKIPTQNMSYLGIVLGQLDDVRTLPTPNSTNVDPEFLPLVELIRRVCRSDNRNPPVEWHFLTNGIAGMTVDVTGMLDFFEYVLESDRQNAALGHPSNIAESIYMVVLAEPHLLNHRNSNAFIQEEQRHPRWRRYGTKFVHKNSLAELIRRHQLWEDHWRMDENSLIAGNGHLPLPYMGEEHRRLTAHNSLWEYEFDWRRFRKDTHFVVELSGRIVDMRIRNFGRNNPWLARPIRR